MLNGFELILPDPPTPLPQGHVACPTPESAAACGHCVNFERLRYFRSGDSGRQFTEEQRVEGLTVFRFPAGEECFQQHSIPNGREMLYSIERQKVRGTDWIESLGEELDKR